jgi:hypothetical protein
MFISSKERQIVQAVYKYWNARDALAKELNKKSLVYKNITKDEIQEKLVIHGFGVNSLRELCTHLKSFKIYGKEHKDKREESILQRRINRLFAGNYIQHDWDQINVTDKGVLAATDRYWLTTMSTINAKTAPFETA